MNQENKKLGTIWSKALIILSEAGCRGIRVDVKGLKNYLTRVQLELSEVAAAATQMTGIEKLNSPKVVAKWLDKLGIEGSGSSKERLQLVGKDRSGSLEVAELIMKQRNLQRICSSGLGLLERVDFASDRLYYEWKASEKTGRLYSNIQNYPGPLRDYFLPDEGEQIVVMDYKSQELRLLLMETGEIELLEALDRGEDFHRKIASWVFKKAEDQVTDAERDKCKAVTYGIPYGQLEEGLVYRWGISKERALKILKDYHKLRPKLQPWIDAEVEKAMRLGYVETRAGQRRYNCPEKNVVNTRIQAEAADILCGALVRVNAKLKRMKARVLASVHDSIIISVRLSILDNRGSKMIRAEDIVKVHSIQKEMEKTERGRMPVDIAVGSTWGICHRRLKEE